MYNKKLTILITGGTRGLGRKMAESMAKQGHEIYVIAKKSESEIEPGYLSAITDYLECDLSNANAIKGTFAELINKTGRIDVLINNATVREFKKLDEFKPEDIQSNINVDFVAPAVLSNLCLPFMKKNGFGRIINISSISAYKVYPGGSLYCSSKRALIAFTETLGKELEPLNGSVTVNAICPDSFSRIDGTGLRNYDLITESVLTVIEKIIKSKSNGKAISVFTFKHKIRERLRFLKQAILMQ
jgi:3-oxoacyl-[acyl-carrier protein] reductase